LRSWMASWLRLAASTFTSLVGDLAWVSIVLIERSLRQVDALSAVT
jgi:hypothetical protein